MPGVPGKGNSVGGPAWESPLILFLQRFAPKHFFADRDRPSAHQEPKDGSGILPWGCACFASQHRPRVCPCVDVLSPAQRIQKGPRAMLHSDADLRGREWKRNIIGVCIMCAGSVKPSWTSDGPDANKHRQRPRHGRRYRYGQQRRR